MNGIVQSSVLGIRPAAPPADEPGIMTIAMRFDGGGGIGGVGRTLETRDDDIAPGLVTRLHRYALRMLTLKGFGVGDWDCEVYTMDGDERPSDRSYTVEFTNALGGMIGVAGILTAHGHPTMHHELCIDGR